MGTAGEITIEQLLQATSRTFALSIPMLPQPLNHEITLAYLVFRIADTMEDADYLDRDTRQQALCQFCEVLDDLRPETVESWTQQWSGQRVTANDDYARLLQETPQVLGQVRELPSSRRAIVVQHAVRSASGMAAVLDQADDRGQLQLGSIQELRDYCYFVAGIVGELITELLVSERYDEVTAKPLAERAAAFGEALQLVNILKDSDDDKLCGRSYLPDGLPRSEVFDIAYADIETAKEYVQVLRDLEAPGGFIAFCDAPLALAEATLRVVAEHGPGSKVPRDETFALLQQVLERAGIPQ